MKPQHTRIGTLAALLLAAALQPAQAAGTVEVRWIEPARYADAGRSPIDRERALDALARHLRSRAAWLPDGQALVLEVTDVDLAGELEPWGWQELRVLRGRVDGPRLTLRYTLGAGGQTLKAGEVRLSELGGAFRRHDGPLGPEKQLLDRWLRTEFGAH